MAKRQTRAQQIKEALLNRYLRYGYDDFTAEELKYIDAMFAASPTLKKQMDRKRSGLGLGQASAPSSGVPGAVSKARANNEELGDTQADLAIAQKIRNRRISSPGGFKKSGEDYASRMRKAGGVTYQGDDGSTVQFEKDGSAILGYRDANGKFIQTRKLTKRETDAVLQRAQSGATLGREQQSIYDRSLVEQDKRRKEAQRNDTIRRLRAKLGIPDDEEWTEEELLLENQRRDAAAKASEEMNKWKTQEDYKAKIARDKAENDSRLDMERQIAVAKAKDEYERQKAKEANDAFNEKYGIDEGRELREVDKRAIENGTKTWGYSPDTLKKFAELQSQMDGIIGSDSASLDELAELYRQQEEYKKRFPKRLLDVPGSIQEPTTIEKKGREYVNLGDGKWTMLTDGKRAEEKEQRKKDRMQERKDRYIDERVKVLAKEELENEYDEYGNNRKKYPTYESQLEQAKNEAKLRFAGEDVETAEEENGWVFGSDYGLDVEHGYSGTYDQWVAEYHPEWGAVNGSETFEDTTQVQAPEGGDEQQAGHMKSSYL